MSVGRLLGRVNDSQSLLRAYAIAGDHEFLNRYRRSVALLPVELQEFQRMAKSAPPDDGVRRKYGDEQVVNATNAAITHLQQESSLLAQGTKADVATHLRNDALNGVMDEFREVGRGYQLEELARQRREHAELEHLAEISRDEAIAIVAANILIALALFWFLQRHVRRRLGRVLRNMSLYAAGQPLHPVIESPDEIGRLDVAFHEMAEQLTATRLELENRTEELARMNVEKSHFMGMAAHDLRNPLFGTLMGVEGLLRRRDLPERDQLILRRMQTALKAMTNLVSDFLDVSLIESGELRLRLAPVDVAALACECAEMTRIIAEPKQIELNCELRGRAVANVDRDKIAQVIANFLTNAVKYSPSGSKVGLSVTQTDGMVRVSVRDEGPGIAPEEIERLFRPFARASTRPTAGESSTGLGLAICRKVVEGHRGRIWAESVVGKGSVFSFEVPRD